VLWNDPRLALNTDEAACSTVGAEIRELRTLIWDPGVIRPRSRQHHEAGRDAEAKRRWLIE
jgi:hypothetical protein